MEQEEEEELTEAFEHVTSWLKDLREHADENVSIIRMLSSLVGNLSDVQWSATRLTSALLHLPNHPRPFHPPHHLYHLLLRQNRRRRRMAPRISRAKGDYDPEQ